MEWEAEAKVGRGLTREHGIRIKKMKGAWKTCPGGTKVDGSAGGGLAIWIQVGQWSAADVAAAGEM